MSLLITKEMLVASPERQEIVNLANASGTIGNFAVSCSVSPEYLLHSGYTLTDGVHSPLLIAGSNLRALGENIRIACGIPHNRTGRNRKVKFLSQEPDDSLQIISDLEEVLLSIQSATTDVVRERLSKLQERPFYLSGTVQLASLNDLHSQVMQAYHANKPTHR